ncbi:MAG: hypothetical protein IPG97_15730, partial [Microthrixaceae bacterium]|nr:hypothetical protein [Microthrixaceae bacterium]
MARSERERGVTPSTAEGAGLRPLDRSGADPPVLSIPRLLAWLATDPDVVWLDSLLLHRDGEAALLHGRARHVDPVRPTPGTAGWQGRRRSGRPGPGHRQVVVPPMPTGVVAEAMDLLDHHLDTGSRFGSRLTVTRIDDLAPDYEVSFLINAGHDLSDLSPPLTGWRVALAAFEGPAMPGPA